ncbi:MAG: hypothetical protein HZB55_03440 [Deltaproteobacteria bacterium]|nr:hypothetical protein [Deltaproteobacteria bacterium]
MEGTETQGLEVTWNRALAVLWGFLWRLVFLAGVVNAIAAGVFGVVVAFVLTPPIASVVSVAVFLVLTLVSAVPIMRSVLTNRFADFSIRLVPNEDGPPTP